MDDLIHGVGIEIETVPATAQRLSGGYAAYYNLPSKEVIYVSDACPTACRAFVLSHELGHAILHDVELAHCGLLYKKGKMEEEADYFAVQILRDDYELIEGYTTEDYAKLYGMRDTATEYLYTRRPEHEYKKIQNKKRNPL